MNPKVSTALRYVGTSGGTLIGLLGAIALLTPEQAQDAMAALHQMMDGINQASLGAGKLFIIIGPALGTLFAYFGVKSSGVAAAVAFVKSKMSAEATAPKSAPAPVTAAITAAVAQSPIVIGTPTVMDAKKV